jgi:hypothetical protein
MGHSYFLTYTRTSKAWVKKMGRIKTSREGKVKALYKSSLRTKEKQELQGSA